MKSLLDEYLGLKQAAHAIGWGESTLRRRVKLAAEGKIPKADVPPCTFYNRKYYFRAEGLVRWFVQKIEREGQ